MDYPLINGTRHDYSSIEIKLKDDVFVGVREIKYKDALKRGKLYGTHPEPIGRGRGVYSAEASIVMYLEEANYFRAALGEGYKEVPFDIVVSYTENEKTITDTIVGAVISDDEGGGTQGAEGLTCPWALDVFKVLWNGIDSLKKPLDKVRVTGAGT